MRTKRRRTGVSTDPGSNLARAAAACIALVCLAPGCGLPGLRRPPPPTAQSAQLLFVQSAEGASFSDGRLTLRRVSPATLFFSDRPQRIAGHVLTRRFIADWGKGANSFAQDPPNATLSTVGGRHMTDAVLVLSNPRFRGVNLVYDARVLRGAPPARGGPTSLFIDAIGSLVAPGLLVRPQLRRPYSWDTYIYQPDPSVAPPPSSAGTGPYGDLTTPSYYGENPYAQGWDPTPPRAYTFE